MNPQRVHLAATPEPELDQWAEAFQRVRPANCTFARFMDMSIPARVQVLKYGEASRAAIARGTPRAVWKEAGPGRTGQV